MNLRKTDLDDMVVRAPFSGVAISKDAQPGEMISPVSAGGGFTRTGIGTIVDMSSLEIEVDVNESFINRVRPAQKVVAVLDAYPDWQIPAHVITTVPSADRQKATVRVRIGFDSPQSKELGAASDPRILPDMGVKVSFLARRAAGDDGRAGGRACTVPKAAVRTVDGRTVVFVVRTTASSAARSRPATRTASRSKCCRASAPASASSSRAADTLEGRRSRQDSRLSSGSNRQRDRSRYEQFSREHP